MKNAFFELTELSINTILVPSENIMSFVIFSSIDQPALQFEMIFNDRLDFKNQLPLKGGESIKLLMVDQYQQQIDLQFTLTSFTTLTNKETTSYMTIKAVSSLGLKLATTRVYTSWDDTITSDIVKSMSDAIEVTTSEGAYPIVAAGMTQTQLITKLSKLAYSEKYKAMYVFYEDLNSIKFKPLNELLAVKEVNTFKINNQNVNYRYNILEYEETKNVNVLAQAHDNYYDNTYVHYNPDTKKIYTNQRTIKDVNEETTSLGLGQVFSDSVASDQSTRLKPFIIESDGEFYPTSVNSIGFALYTKKMTYVLNGDFNVQVGTLMNVNIPNKYEKTEFATENAGLWLVEKAAYHFNQSEFKMKVLVTKNATHADAISNTGAILNPDIKV
jgi:hypothetical protein